MSRYETQGEGQEKNYGTKWREDPHLGFLIIRSGREKISVRRKDYSVASLGVQSGYGKSILHPISLRSSELIS